jgi:hypothetical protein
MNHRIAIFRLILALAVFFPGLLVFADVPLIQDGQIFPSPDGNFSVQLAQVDGNEVLSIKNSKTGIIDNSQSVQLPPVFEMTWTGDAQSIVTVGHIAGGSQATVYHFNGAWSEIDIAPDDGAAYDVIGLQIGRSSVAVSYKVIVHVTKSNGAPMAVYEKLVMTANPATGMISTGKIQKITRAAYNTTPGAEQKAF